MANSTRKSSGGKAVSKSSSGKPGPCPRPEKPSKDFPLFPHRTGNWAKKVRGRTRYFGSWKEDPKGVAALAMWLEQKDDLLAGREYRPKGEGLTVADLCNHYLTHKKTLRDNNELAVRTYAGNYATCEMIVMTFGKSRIVADLQPADFGKLRVKLAKTRQAVALRNEMQRVRSVFKFGFDEGLIDVPIRFGQQFTKPKMETVRRDREAHRAEHGDRMFEADEIRAILAEAKQPLKAMVLLAANCGLGQTDLAHVPTRAFDLDNGWLDFARVKTSVPRHIPLWPETVAAIREWLPQRPKAKDPANNGLMFLTIRGAVWVKVNDKGSPKDAIAQEFIKVITKLGIRRSKVGFYALRHGFETIAGETADQVAVDAIMGHVQKGMASVYRERISDERLQRVTGFVREWLFPNEKNSSGPASSDPTKSSSHSSSGIDEEATGDSSGPFRLRVVG